MSTVAEQIAEVETKLEITTAILAQLPADISRLGESSLQLLGSVMTADATYRQALAHLTMTEHIFVLDAALDKEFGHQLA